MMRVQQNGQTTWRARSLAMLLVALPILGLAGTSTVSADDEKPAAQVKAEAKIKKAAKKAKAVLSGNAGDVTPEQRAKAQAALDALKELQSAIDRAEKADTKNAASTPAPTFAPRKVVAPTLDSAGLDELVNKALASAKVPVTPTTSDEEFVRRVYLDTVGRIPTLEEIRGFLTTKDKSKRSQLIDRLLASPEFAANLGRYWRDVVFYRAPNPNPNQVGYPYLESWLTEQFAANKPWDEIVRGLITAQGAYDDNGASAFGLAQMAQPVEMAGEVSRVFMGVQIQCAQCHDHPSAPWKRDQFHEFAAFFGGITSKRKMGDNGRTFEFLTKPGIARYNKPDLKDPAKSSLVTPKFFLGDAKPVSDKMTGKDRLATVASYVVAQDNKYFAQAFTNRVWTSLIGEGFYNPVDDMGPGREATAPEVLNALASQWQQGGYDIRWLYRVILNSKAYQHRTRSTESEAGKVPFAANCPSRLRGDQIFDALASALDLPLENLNGRFVRDGGVGKGKNAKAGTSPEAIEKALDKKAKTAAPAAVAVGRAGLAGPRARFNTMFGVDPSIPSDEVLGTIPQALFLMNSPIVNRGVTASNNTMLGELLKSTPNDRAVLDTLYYKVLSRRPTPEEINICGKYIQERQNRKEAFEDILWSLVNSTEFISRR